MAPIRIHLLGGFLIESDGRNVPPIPSAVGRSLFAYLVSNRTRRHTRDLLAGTFWPDLPESAARRRLSQALWQIQAVLQEAVPDRALIHTTAGDVAFDAAGDDYWLDVAEFDRHVSAASQRAERYDYSETVELEEAVGLYRGEFLAGFYDDWTTLERERLRGAYLGALERLIGIHKGRADYDAALSFAKQLSLHDPLRESAHREVMRLCFLLGRSNEALQQYERCVAILTEELGAIPSSETEALRVRIAQLRRKGEQPFAPTFRSPLLDTDRRIPLVGRDEERAAVLGRMERTLLGRGGLVFIEGQSGIGKTRLVEELVDDAQWRGLSVMIAECVESEVLHPLQALRRALEGSLTRLRVEQLRVSLHETTLIDLAGIVPRVAEWLPTPPGPSSAELTSVRLSETIRKTLLALASHNPTVFFIDDLQWIDDESVAIVADLAAELERHRLLVVLGFRASGARERESLWDHLVAMDSAARAKRINLDALDASDAARLIEGSLGVASVAPSVAEGLFLETGGNPLFILESLRAWHEKTQEDLDSDAALGDIIAVENLPVAGGVAQVIRRRLADLPADTVHVLETAAVLGTSFNPSLLGPSAGVTDPAAAAALEDLISKGAFVEADDGYGFSHEQFRRVVVEGLSKDRLQKLHARIGEVTEALQPDKIEVLAYHFTSAGVAEKASHYSLESARRARTLGAYDTAASHFEQAATWSLPADRYQLLCEWEDVLDVLGRRTDQHRLLDELTSLTTTPQHRAELARRRSRLLSHEGRYREAIDIATAAVGEIGDDVAGRDRGAALQNLGLILSRAGHPDDAVPHLEAAAAALADDPLDEAAALCDLGNALGETQQYEGAVEALSRALELYEDTANKQGVAKASGQLATLQMEQGDGESAITLYRRALEMARSLDYRRGVAVNLANLGNALYSQGSVGQALEKYTEAAEVFDEIGDRRGAALLRANSASVRHTIIGDDSVEEDVAASLAFFESEDHEWGQAFCHEHLALIARRRGDSAAALQHIRQGFELLSEGGHRWVEVHLQRLAAQILLDAGDLPAAQEAVVRAGQLCEELGMADVAPTIESLSAMVALADDHPQEALRLARHATQSLHRGVEQAYIVWHRLHVAATRMQSPEEAREALASAVMLLDEVLASLDTDDRHSATTRVPEHLAIFAARDRTFVRSIQIDLPRLGAPLGRPIRPEEWMSVSITISDPSDYGIPDQMPRRHHRLRRIVEEVREQGAAARIRDLASVLDVSVATVRRDLAALRGEGIDVPTRGSR